MTYNERVLLEAERLGMLSQDKKQLIAEARARGLVGPPRLAGSSPLLVAVTDSDPVAVNQNQGITAYQLYGRGEAFRPSTTSLAVDTGVAMTWTATLAAALFFSIAGRLIGQRRDTPSKQAVWFGAIAAAIVPLGILGKLAQRVELFEYIIAFLVLLPVYFLFGFSIGYLWRKLVPLK